jgi:hypothetical protein
VVIGTGWAILLEVGGIEHLLNELGKVILDVSEGVRWAFYIVSFNAKHVLVTTITLLDTFQIRRCMLL